MTDLLSHLTFLYGAERAPALLDRLQNMLKEYSKGIPQRRRSHRAGCHPDHLWGSTSVSK